MTKLLIAGSRHYPSKTDIQTFLRGIPEAPEVILPSSPGPARWAFEAAKARGLKTTVIPTQRASAMRSAISERNQKLARLLGPGDQAMLFLAIDPKSGGYSASLKEIALRAKQHGATVRAMTPGKPDAPIESIEQMPFAHEEPTPEATLFDLFGDDPKGYDLETFG